MSRDGFDDRPGDDYRSEYPTPSYPPLLQPSEKRQQHSRNPLDRLTAGLPRPWRIAIDWIVTISRSRPGW
jgi:hypothetical protein